MYRRDWMSATLVLGLAACGSENDSDAPGVHRSPHPPTARDENVPDAHDPIATQRAAWSRRPTVRPDQVSTLGWAELMEEHRAICMALFREQGLTGDELDPALASGPLGALCRSTTRRLSSRESPFRPHRAAVWQTGAGERPSFEGELVNASVTHLGSVEVLDLNDAGQPVGARVIPYAEIRAIRMEGNALYRAARLELRSGPTLMVATPLLYATSFETANDIDTTGSMTRFSCHLEMEGAFSGGAIGVGQQDLALDATVFGVGSVEEIHFSA